MEETTQAENTLYSLSDEYLAKTKRNRKIIFSVISFLVLAFAVAVIVLSSVNVNLKPAFIDNAVRYEITLKENSTAIVYDDTDAGFEKFDKLFDEAFSINYLTALFTGKLGGYEIDSKNETTDYFYSDTKNNTGMSSSLKNSLGNDYVRVKLAQENQVKYANGKIYKSKYNSDATLVFDELYFNLNTSEEDDSITFYLGTRGHLSGTRITKITVEANTYSLYKFASEN